MRDASDFNRLFHDSKNFFHFPHHLHKLSTGCCLDGAKSVLILLSHGFGITYFEIAGPRLAGVRATSQEWPTGSEDCTFGGPERVRRTDDTGLRIQSARQSEPFEHVEASTGMPPRVDVAKRH